MSLPLNFLPSGRQYTVFHNRDITKEEIEAIIKDAQPREKGYYALMAQSGLRPNEISNLKIGDLENFLEEKTPIPCLITTRQEATKGKYKPYFTFAGQETITFIKEYFKREHRRELTPEDYLFTKDDGKTKTDSDLISHIFRRTVVKLNNQKVLNFANKKSEKTNRNELRLYNLRKYFRNHAGQAGTDFVNFWMGHSLGIDEHYFSQTDIASHRKQYQEKAMPNLRIDTKTPDQNEITITELQNKLLIREKEFNEFKSSSNQKFANQQDYISKLSSLVYSLVDQKDKEPELQEQENYDEYQRRTKQTPEQRKTEDKDLEKGLKLFEKSRENNGENTKVEHFDYESAFNALLKRVAQLEAMNSEDKQKGKG